MVTKSKNRRKAKRPFKQSEYDKLVEEVERVGFIKTEKKGRIFLFAKRGNTPE